MSEAAAGRFQACRLVLASASPARLTLLRAAGLEVTVRPAAIDEAAIKRDALADGVAAEDTALLLARLKARRVAAAEPDALVIAADQLLVCDGRWFDKPATLADARAQLVALRGRSHALPTAVLCQRGGQEVWHHVARPRLTMRTFSEPFLDAYLAAEAAALATTVGGYRLEGLGAQLFDAVDGEHAAILGLPLLPLLGFLRQHGCVLA